ncbi:MAG: ribonuclease HII, partial [Salinisphaera sp.]|nr:ribonuclease HII [Salinisphaera sp.]
LVAGVDEAGVGPLAGPVVAAAVICPPSMRIAGVNDSKQLEATRRAALAEAIHAGALGVGVGVAEVEEIDRCNIYQASLQAMARAIRALPMRPEHLLVDARSLPGIGIPQESIIHGDGLSFSIAAASIIAKTHRDQLMQELDRCYPGYGLARHKGYGTAEHLQALHERGPSPIHRKSYAPVRRSMEQAGCS